MQRETLRKANELKKQIDNVDSFIYNYKLTWSQGFLERIKSQIMVGHKGYGYFNKEKMECDKEISEAIYQNLLLYQEKINNQFQELGKEKEDGRSVKEC